MKTIIKTEGIITNAFGPNSKIENKNLRSYRRGYFAFVTIKVDGKNITSENTISISINKNNGDYTTVWYVYGKNKRIFSNPVSAFIFG